MLTYILKKIRAIGQGLFSLIGLGKKKAKDETTPFLLRRNGDVVICSVCGDLLDHPSFLVPSKPTVQKYEDDSKLLHYKWKYTDMCFSCVKTLMKITNQKDFTPDKKLKDE